MIRTEYTQPPTSMAERRMRKRAEEENNEDIWTKSGDMSNRVRFFLDLTTFSPSVRVLCMGLINFPPMFPILSDHKHSGMGGASNGAIIIIYKNRVK